MIFRTPSTPLLSQADRDRIERAIREVEARTSGELVTVVAAQSDHYLFISLLYAAAGAFTIAPVLWALDVTANFLSLYVIQIAAFLLLLLLLRWRPALMALVPDSLQRLHAERLAREQFVNLGLADTPERGGILLFVSMAERYVEVIADRGIHERVSVGIWSKAVAAFAEPVKQGRIAEGYLAAIEILGNQLVRQMPADPDNPNRFPDVLIELPG
ncbi:MAG TPA: TPM domain-containing protein [Hypericibacter adhaerens]|jgi:putative membrane protein|uniref:Membrane protein n=1 Tax=Hypericibacter adhaerens TaxID=2602016 RepID=A0A5J6MZN6_9PROT|nr:TPM domain-containing protein [Hypericibacter adhaerens]QEX22105.1 membrane protein [Hypericibacter adhaerens]HWA41563.1 TPM domain-containing protein [Hypericibacter adhaerens]